MSKADVGCQRCVCARCVLRARWSLGLRVCELLFTTTRLWGPRVFLASIRRNCCFGWSTFAFLVVAFTLLRSSIRKWPVTKNKHKKTHQRKKPDQKQKTKNTHKTRTKKGKKKKKLTTKGKRRNGWIDDLPGQVCAISSVFFLFWAQRQLFRSLFGNQTAKKKKVKEKQKRKPAKKINHSTSKNHQQPFQAVGWHYISCCLVWVHN